MTKTFKSPERKNVRLLKHANDWRAGDTVMVDEALADRWIRQGIAQVLAEKSDPRPTISQSLTPSPGPSGLAQRKDQSTMNLSPYKTHRIGATKYKTAEGEQIWLYDEEYPHFVQYGVTSLDPIDRDGALKRIAAMLEQQTAEYALGRTILARRRAFEPEDLGRFIQDIVSRNPDLHPGQTRKEYLLKRWGAAWGTSQKAALAEASGVTGGYGVPWELAEPLTMTIASQSIFRAYGALSQPTSSTEVQIPVPVITTASAGVPNWYGGISFTWTSESQTRTDTEPAFKELALKLWERSGTITASGPIIDDAPGLSSYLRKAIPLAVAYDEDYAFLQGTGAGQPQGVIGASCTLTQTRQTPNQIQFADSGGMQAKLLPSSFGHAIWLFNPSVVPQLAQLKDGASRAVFIGIHQGDAGPSTWSFMGRPAIPTTILPSLGTTGDLMLIDPRWYVIGDYERENGTLEIAASLHVKFIQNQIVMRVVRRIDGRPMIPSALTLQDGNTYSPFIALQ